MADLTRFDFHAMKFQESEAISMMDASEVGQFVLLMVKAWLLEKDASLPDDTPYLGRVARVVEVSQRVLAEWPVVETEWGMRRQNHTLYGEWMRAKQRSDVATEKAIARWGKAPRIAGVDEEESRGNAPALLLHSRGTAGVSPQSKINPNQSESSQCAEAGAGGQESKANLLGDWHTFAVKYKQAFGGKKASAFFKTKYAEACTTFTEDTVLACFDDWSPEAKSWAEAKGIEQPLHAFFKKLTEMAGDRQAEAHIEQTQAREAEQHAAQAKQRDEANAAAVEASIERQKAEDVAFMTKTPPPQNECHPFDIIPPADDDHSPYAEEWRAAQKGAE